MFLTAIVIYTAAFNADYTQWRGQQTTWIRVAVQEKDSKPRFSSRSKVLVLDGERVVGSFRPNGTFWILKEHPGTSAATAYWVQLQASKATKTLEKTRQAFLAKYPKQSFSIKTLKKNRMKTLQAGPFASHKEARSFQKEAVSAGVHDAFLLQSKSGEPYVWVDHRFNKYPLPGSRLGLVSADPNQPLGFHDKQYRGILWINAKGLDLKVINELPLESYLLGVVPAEMGPNQYPELEALKAQAIAARTYALKNMGRFKSRGYDICDTPACQAYEGFGAERELSTQAVQETTNQALVHKGRLIDALYTSTCGGHTDDVENVFPGRYEPYLRGKSSYLAQYQSWTLPAKPIPGDDDRYDDLLARAFLLGMDPAPQLNGTITGDLLQSWLTEIDWVWTPWKQPLPDSIPTRADFYTLMARHPVFSDVLKHQISDPDAARVYRSDSSVSDSQRLFALLARFDLVGRDVAMGLERPLTRFEALGFLVDIAEAFGPAYEWKKFYVTDINGSSLELFKKPDKQLTINLDDMRHYLKKHKGLWSFTAQPLVEEHDIVYIPDKPFKSNVIWLASNGSVASVDRFSFYESWVEKKSLAELEKRARRYVSGLSGLRSVAITKRSDTGRVTELVLKARSGTHVVDGLRIRWSMGIRDNFFDIIPTYHRGVLVYATFIGRGWGHGVGMSQVGAFGLAKMGWDANRILTYYYTDVDIVDWTTLSP